MEVFMNIAKLIMGIALCAISGCAQFSGKTENASSISAEAIRCIKIAVDEEVCKSNFNEALALNVLDYINGIVENKKLNDELSKKEKDEILRLVTEEYNRLKSQVIYPAWAKYVWSNVERKAAGFINSSDYKKAIETIENRVSSGNSEVDALVASLANKYLDEVLCPSWLRFEIKKVDDAVAKLIAEKKFLEAREVLWNAPLTGVAKVDEPLRVHCVKVMRKNVNPVHWPILESEIKGIYKKYSEKESEYEICIEKLKAYNLQRPYSIKIERKLALVVSEALKLGVNKDSVHPVFSAAKNLLKEAANLVDNRDVSTTNTSTRISKAAFSPELEKYNLALQEFRVHLIKYDCTEKSADVVVSTVDSMMRPLLSSLAKDAEYEKISSMEFELGITALNNRIAALRDQLVSDVKTKIEKRELRKLQGKVSSLTEKVVALAKAGRFAEAREMAWKAAADDPRVRQVAVDVITNIINPMHWKEAEKEISDKIAKFINDGSYNQAVAWLAKYPRIRTYSSEIDVKLSAVGDEALKLGLDSEKVQSVIVETKDLASIVERLVNNTDREVPLDEKKQLVSDGLTAALDEYVKALKRHDCTDENALKLADFVKKRLSLVFEDSLSKTSSTKMELGSNAFNKRLDALIVAQRNKVLDSEYNFV